MQSHVVFGAGLIGTFLGGVLTSKNINTKLVSRPSIQQKLANGLTITDYSGNKSFLESITFTETNAAVFCDFLWLTVKCTGIEAASKEMFPFVGPDTIIFCCQNGLGSDHIIKKRYPYNTVLRVMVPFNIAEPKPGHLHRGSEGALCLETNQEHTTTINTLVSILNTPIMPVTQTTEMSALLWAKLQLNLGNSVNALADIPVKKMLAQRKYRLVIAMLMRELLKVTKAQHIKLPKLTAVPAQYLPLVLSLPNFMFVKIANKMLAIDPTVRTSMWWDLSQGKKTEIDYLNGAIVDTAKTLDINCPVNTKVISLIKKIEQANNKQHPRKSISCQALLEETRKSK